MGCCFSIDKENVQEKPLIVVESSDSTSVDQLISEEAVGDRPKMDPLFDGAALLAFQNLQLSSDSSTVDIDLGQVEKLLADQKFEDIASQSDSVVE